MKCIFLLLHFTNIYNILCIDYVIKFKAIRCQVISYNDHFVHFHHSSMKIAINIQLEIILLCFEHYSLNIKYQPEYFSIKYRCFLKKPIA